MICLETQYFNVNKILLLAVGLWPYQQTKLAQFQFIFFSGVLTTITIFQFTTFMTSRYTMNLLLKILPNALCFAIFVIEYNWFRFNIEIMKDLLGQLFHICNNIKDDNEIAIIEKYGYNAKYYTIAITIFVVSSVPAVIILQFWPLIRNIIAPTNVSQSLHMVIPMEYFVDQDKYFYLILLHINVAIGIAAIAMLAIGTMFLTYFQYMCGMFTIASYRIEHAMEINMLLNLKNENLIFKKIICAVDIHRQSMKLSTLLMSAFEMPFFCIVIFGVLFLSLNLLQIFQIASSGNNIKEYFLPALFIFFDILYMFLGNYVGQDIMDHNRRVFATAYDVQWYIAPLHIQKLILFLLQRGVKDFTLNYGGLFVSSMQCFATLMNASVSYFTFIYSTRK